MKCISLIKLTSTLNTLFQLKRNVFLWEKGWNKSRRQYTKSFVIVQIFMSVITLGFFVSFPWYLNIEEIQEFLHHWKPFSNSSYFCFTLQRQIKSATGKCNMSVLHYTVMLHFFNELAKVSLVLVYTMTDKLNTDQALIQITRLENVQDIGSAQRSQIHGPSHWSFPSL